MRQMCMLAKWSFFCAAWSQNVDKLLASADAQAKRKIELLGPKFNTCTSDIRQALRRTTKSRSRSLFSSAIWSPRLDYCIFRITPLKTFSSVFTADLYAWYTAGKNRNNHWESFLFVFCYIVPPHVKHKQPHLPLVPFPLCLFCSLTSTYGGGRSTESAYMLIYRQRGFGVEHTSKPAVRSFG